jgi:hypothetical protein
MNNRPSIGVYPVQIEAGPERAYTTEQLAQIEAITLIWSQVEAHIDFLLYIVFAPPLTIWTTLVKRLKGIDGKLEFLRLGTTDSNLLDDGAKTCIRSTLDAVTEYKDYMDSIESSVLLEIGRRFRSDRLPEDDVSETIVSLESLHAIYNRLVLLIRELQAIGFMFRLDNDCHDPVRDDHRQGQSSRKHGAMTHMIQVRGRQDYRLSLPPIPKFPG